jgi:hypothetical protein
MVPEYPVHRLFIAPRPADHGRTREGTCGSIRAAIPALARLAGIGIPAKPGGQVLEPAAKKNCRTLSYHLKPVFLSVISDMTRFQFYLSMHSVKASNG